MCNHQDDALDRAAIAIFHTIIATTYFEKAHLRHVKTSYLSTIHLPCGFQVVSSIKTCHPGLVLADLVLLEVQVTTKYPLGFVLRTSQRNVTTSELCWFQGI